MGKGTGETGATDLWSFALRMWEQRDVPAAAIALQDRWSLSVCLLLGALWLERRGGPVDGELAARLVERAVLRDREWILPLRRLRREASQRPEWSDWKRHLQKAELEAERLLLSELESLIAGTGLSNGDPGPGWLEQVLPRDRSEEMEALLEVLRGAARQCG